MKRMVPLFALIVSCFLSSEVLSSIPNCSPVTTASEFWYECDGTRFTQIAALNNGDAISEFEVKDMGTLGYLVYWKYYNGASQESAYYKTYDGVFRYRVTQDDGQASELKLFYILPSGEEKWFWRYKHLASQETAYFAAEGSSSNVYSATAITHVASEGSGDVIDEFNVVFRGLLGFVFYWRYNDGSNQDSAYYYQTLGSDLSNTSQRHMITQIGGRASELKLFYGTGVGGELWYWKYQHGSGSFGYYFRDNDTRITLITQLASGQAGDIIDEFTITPPSGGTPGLFPNNLLTWRYYDAQYDRWGCYYRDTYLNPTITEYTTGCSLPPTMELYVAPTTVVQGELATLEWSSDSATYCIGDGGNTIAASGSVAWSPPSTRTLTVSCYGEGGRVSKNVTVTVIPSPTMTLDIFPSTINQGETSTISWTSNNTTHCIGDGGNTIATSGSVTWSPPSTRTLTVSCHGKGGSVSKSVTVTVL